MIEYLDKHTKIGQIQQKLFENRPKVEEITRKAMTLKVYHNEDPQEKPARMTDEHRLIRARDTQNLFMVDVEDWDLAKHVPWYEKEPGVLTSARGETFERYVGIVGKRLFAFNRRDKRRERYLNC